MGGFLSLKQASFFPLLFSWSIVLERKKKDREDGRDRERDKWEQGKAWPTVQEVLFFSSLLFSFPFFF